MVVVKGEKMEEERAMTLQEFCEFKRREIKCFEEDMKNITEDYNKSLDIEYWEECFEEDMKIHHDIHFPTYTKLLIEYGFHKYQK